LDTCSFLWHKYWRLVNQLVRTASMSGVQEHNASPRYLQVLGGTLDLYNCPGTQDCSRIGQPGGVDSGTHSGGCCRRTDFEDSASAQALGAELRSHRKLVAFDIDRRATDRGTARNAGAAAHKGPLCRVAWTGHGAGDSRICLPHAGAF